LLYPPNLALTDAAKKRLEAIQEFSQLGSGYQLAMLDMEIRGLEDHGFALGFAPCQVPD